MLSRNRDDNFTCMSLAEVWQDFLPDVDHSKVPKSEGNPVYVLFCSANYETTKITLANHFIPVYEIEHLPAGFVEKSRQDLQNRLADLNSKHLKSSDNIRKKFSDNDLGEDATTEFVKCLSLAKENRELMRKIERFAALQADLQKIGMFGIEVLADGNCGLHAALALQKGPLFKEASMQEVDAIRNEIAEYWIAKTTCPRWTQVFLRMSQVFDRELSPHKKPNVPMTPKTSAVKRDHDGDETPQTKKNKTRLVCLYMMCCVYNAMLCVLVFFSYFHCLCASRHLIMENFGRRD